MTWWTTCMMALLALSVSPLLIPTCYERGYPLTLRIAVAVALVVLATVSGDTGASVTLGLILIGAAGVAPIVVDGLLDRAPAGHASHVGGGMDHDAGAAAATVSASLAAVTATSAF